VIERRDQVEAALLGERTPERVAVLRVAVVDDDLAAVRAGGRASSALRPAA
jgi:hypothetical protein